MNFVFGSFLAAVASLLTIFAGYTVAGFLTEETPATRVALASLLGLAWVVFVASVVGAVMPLRGVVTWMAWVPSLAVFALPATRRQLVADIVRLTRSPMAGAATAGLGLLWVALLLPFLVFPDLLLFDGKTNHDNFFWCVGAQYLQSHDYLTVAARNRDFPLFNLTWSFCGWRPAWARMASEGYVALTSGSFGLPAIRLYNFLISALVLPWTLVTFAVARRMGLPPLRPCAVACVFFCQPILFFFVANGNGPNLIGTLFSGGLWLVALLLADREGRLWPLVVTGVFFLHGILASYPEILVFALAPIGLLVLRQIFAGISGRFRLLGLMLAIVLIGLCLNPVTTIRLWTGIQNSIGQARNDSGWANIFDRVTFAGYLPSFITLGVPSIRLYGLPGGLVASLAVAVGIFQVFKSSPRRLELFFPMAGFLTLVAYTVLTSFGYGWQKSVQFFGIPLAAMFPVLLVGITQEKLRAAASHRLVLIALLGTLGVMVHTLAGVTAENLKSATSKALTRPMLALQTRAAAEFPGQPIYVDGATFRAAFFQSMWSARLFPANPIVFISRQDQAGGYLRDFVQLDNPTGPATTGRYYVAANWARAFDYDPVPLMTDRVGVVLKQHNLIPEMAGFYRVTGVPEMCKAEFSLTVYPYADGWLEFTLEPNGTAAAQCKLNGSVVTAAGALRVETSLDAGGHVVARFPVRAGTRNAITATISGGPRIDPEVDDPPYPFRVLRVSSGRTP